MNDKLNNNIYHTKYVDKNMDNITRYESFIFHLTLGVQYVIVIFRAFLSYFATCKIELFQYFNILRNVTRIKTP